MFVFDFITGLQLIWDEMESESSWFPTLGCFSVGHSGRFIKHVLQRELSGCVDGFLLCEKSKKKKS